MATLTPVDFDPFAAAAPAPARKLTPVDYDPFASTGSPDAQGSATPPPTEAPSLLQRLGAGAMGLANLARDPVAPVVEGLGGANLWNAIKRGSASALASTLHTGADVVDQAMLPTRMLYGDNPLGADKVAAQSLAVEKQINADRQGAQAETPRPGLGDLVTNPVEGVRKAAAYYGNTGAESLPMLALALATRNPELGSAMMGAATGAQEYTDLRSQGVPRREAAAAGALTGATEKIGESIGLPAIMSKAGAGTLRRAVATEGGQEGLTQLMQQYIDDQATGNQTSIKDQLLGALDAAVVGGALGGGGHVAINVPEMVSALTGRTAGTPPPLPGQVVEPLASTSTPAVAAPVEAAPAPDDLDTMLAALLAGRADTAPEPAPVPQQVEAPAAAAPASLGEAVAPQMPQAGAMTPADVRAAMDRARVATEAAQGAPPTPAAPMQAPEAAAPVVPEPTPLVDDRASVEALRNEIGWETRGGQMIRGGEVDGDISSGASFGRTSGEVIGRTPWVGKPGPDGESNFWRMRPEQGGKISEKQAHVALDKYAAGQSLNAKERRFIDYARGVAKQYDDAYEADRAQFEQDQADMAEADRVRAVQELRDHQADLSRDDDREALTLAQWVRRAHDAGVSSEKIIDATWDGSVTEQARRLSRHIADQETNRGTDTRATPIGGEGGAGQDQARPAAAGSGVAESTQGFQLEADRPAASIEGARPVASQRGLFAEPTSSDYSRAAIEAKDAQRNGLNGGRADTGDGGLFDGPRPQQVDIEGEAGRASTNEPKLTDFADEPRQRSIARGNEDADRLGLRAAVREALGPVADRVEYLHGYEGLPDKMRRGVESRNALGRKGVTAAMYSPDTGRVFIFTQVTKTPARAVWHAAHEIAGHEGLRALLGDRINPALNIARQNPTVKALADEIYAQRKIADQMKKSGKTHADGVLLATEEALAELAAAVRTGNYEHINERYGVNVPPGIRESVKAAIANFLRRLKAMIDDLFGKHVFTDQDVRSLLEAAWQAAKNKGSIGQPQSALDSTEDQTGNRGTFDPSSPSILESTTHRTPADARSDAAVRRAEAQRTLGGPTAGGAIGWNFDTHKWEGNEGTLRRARTQLDDKMLAWRDVQGSIAEALGRTIPDAQNVYRLENLMHGRVKEGIDALEADRIVPLVQAMDRAKVTPAQLDEYLYARHAKERNAQIASINPAMPDGGSGMTNAEADAILARADTARMAPLARRVDALTHQTRRRLLDSGLITQEQFDAMEAQYQHYVPLRGKQVRENEFDGASQGAGRGLDTRPSPVKNALGRGAGNRAENILGEIIGDAQRSIIASEKARVGRAVMRLVLANPNPALWSVEPVQTERKLDATGEVYEAVVHDWSDPSIIAVRHRGNVYKVQINFAPLAQALNMVGVDQLSGLTRAAGALNRYFSSVLTRYNPAFIPVNAARDALFGLTGMSVEHGELAAMQAALYYPKAIRAAWKEARRAPPTTEADRFAREFAEDGGKTGYVHMPSVEDLARKIGDGRLGSYNPHGIARAGRALADMVGAMNDSVENALRLSAYATLRKRGMSREAAAAYAKEMTVNFNRKGYAGSKLNAWLLFYNASMQGAKRTVTLAKHPKTWAYLGALAAAQVAAVMYGMGQDDDDGTPIWDKVPDYVKQRNLVFTWLDDGGQQHLLTIPMPYGFNIMPYLAGRVTDAMMHREDRPQDSGMAIAADVMSASVQSFSPVPLDDGALGLVPTALRIPLSIQVNRNDWGRQIRKENPFGKFDVPRSTVGRPDTLEIFKVASKGLNRIGGGDDYTPPPMSAFDLAPEDIQYIVDKLGGGAGKFVVDVATLGQMAAGDAPVTSRDVPIVNRFTKTVDDKAAQQAMF